MARPLRVLSLSIVFPNPTEPGCGIFVERRLEKLAERGAVVKVLAPVQLLDWGNWRHRFLRARGVLGRRTRGPLDIYHPRWFYPPFSGALLGPILAIQMLPRCLRLWWGGFRFDLIDAHFGHPEGVAASILAGIFHRPFIITIRGNEPIHAQRRPRLWAQRWAFRRAARIIAVSAPLRRFAISVGVDPARAVAIPNGIDGNRYRRRDRAVARAKHGIDPARPLILSAGYLVEGKGHHHVVEALAGLHREGIPAKLVIAGGPGREGDFEPEIRAAIDRHGVAEHVTMTGAVSPEALAELMSAADLLCLASHTEGWPNVVHEAMACGTPVVATDVGGVPELISSPDRGIVVPPRDQGALQAALARALRRKWDPAVIEGWARARTWDNVAGEVLGVMEEVVGP